MEGQPAFCSVKFWALAGSFMLWRYGRTVQISFNLRKFQCPYRCHLKWFSKLLHAQSYCIPGFIFDWDVLTNDSTLVWQLGIIFIINIYLFWLFSFNGINISDSLGGKSYFLIISLCWFCFKIYTLFIMPCLHKEVFPLTFQICLI